MLRRYRAAQSGPNPFALLALDEQDRQMNLELSLQVGYDQLDDDARRRFRALGAFAEEGAFSTAALAALWDQDDLDAAADGARFLAGASLLERAEDGRWRQHTLLRVYALALLQREGEDTAARDRHFAWHAAEYGDAEHNRPEAAPGRHGQIAADFDNIRHALAHGFAVAPEAAGDLVDALDNSYLQFDQPPAARRALLEDTLDAVRRADYARGEANTLKALGDLERMEAHYGAARARYEAALTLFQAIPDRLGEANTLKALGDLEVREAHYGAARARYEAALTLFQAIPDRLGEANTLQALGILHQAEGDLEGAGAGFAAAAALYAAIGLPRDEAVMKAMFAQLRLAQGRPDEAIALIRAALEVFEARDLAQDVHVTRGIIARFAAAIPDFAARWQALAGEPPPAWLRDMLAAKELLARLVEWI